VPVASEPTKVIEEKIFEVRLNGYSIVDWPNKEVRNLEISYAIGAVGSGALIRFEQACERAVPRHRMSFHSSLLLQYVGLRASMPEKDSYVLTHVHGELSDVVAVNRGACIFFGSYPGGIRSIVRAVAHATKTDQAAADSFLSLYTDKNLEQGKALAAAPAMKRIGEGWLKEYRDLISQSGASLGTLPNMIVVARFHQGFFAAALREAYPLMHVDTKQIDPSLYARAIHSLHAVR